MKKIRLYLIFLISSFSLFTEGRAENLVTGLVVGNSFTITTDLNLSKDGKVEFFQDSPGIFIKKISGLGSVIKNGGSILTLSGFNTYRGGTNVNEGVLKGNTSSLQGNIFNNATIHFDQNFDDFHLGDISGVGSLIKSGTGILLLLGNNTYSGGTSINDGVLIGDTNSLQGNISNNATINFKQDFDSSYNGVITGDGELIKTGKGRLTLSGYNSYSNGTIVREGILSGNTNSLIGNILNNSIVNFNQSFDDTYSGTITGNGSLIKSGKASLRLEADNNYIGGTTIESGTLIVNTNSLHGNVLNNAQIHFDQSLDDLFIGQISGNGHLLKTGAGELYLSNTNTYTGGTLINEGTLKGDSKSLYGDIANNSKIIFNQESDGSYDFMISGSGEVIKEGLSALKMTGSNTYLGGTTINSGELIGNTNSLQGEILNNSIVHFDQSFNDTFRGTLSGNGSLIKSGSGKLILSENNKHYGNTIVKDGILVLNGDFGDNSKTLLIESNGTLRGSGHITGDVNVSGTVFPGNSIGTIQINGNYTQSPGSSLEMEFDASTSDKINVLGDINIQNNTNLYLVPIAQDTFTANTTYTLMEVFAPGTQLNGTFTNVISPPAFDLSLEYNPTSMVLRINSIALSNVFDQENFGEISNYLDSLPTPDEGDLDYVVSLLQSILTVDELKDALDQLHPAMYKNLVYVQQANSTHIQKTISSRMNFLTKKRCVLYAKPTQKFNLWADSFYDHIRQNNKTHKMGFSSNSAYGVLGGDYRFSNEAILGSFAAYSYSRINWLNMKGKGNINSIYLGAYSGLVKNAGFINGSVLGSLNLNNANRNIYFSSITRKAEGDFDGLQVSARLNGAITKNLKKMQCQPFFEFDYEYIYNEKIKEKKAQDLNLMIDSKNYNMLRGELGCNFSTCFHTRDNSSQWFPEAKVSWIGEKRMGGKRYRSHLVDQKDYFIVTADNPNSVRVGLGAGLTATFEKEKFTANLRYDIEFARKFDDQKAQIAIYYNFK